MQAQHLGAPNQQHVKHQRQAGATQGLTSLVAVLAHHVNCSTEPKTHRPSTSTQCTTFFGATYAALLDVQPRSSTSGHYRQDIPLLHSPLHLPETSSKGSHPPASCKQMVLAVPVATKDPSAALWRTWRGAGLTCTAQQKADKKGDTASWHKYPHGFAALCPPLHIAVASDVEQFKRTAQSCRGKLKQHATHAVPPKPAQLLRPHLELLHHVCRQVHSVRTAASALVAGRLVCPVPQVAACQVLDEVPTWATGNMH